MLRVETFANVTLEHYRKMSRFETFAKVTLDNYRKMLRFETFAKATLVKYRLQKLLWNFQGPGAKSRALDPGP